MKKGGRYDKARNAYFAAVQAGMDSDYRPMEKLFGGIIARTLGGS